jgi:tryptophan-rich sensory protein
MRLLITLTPLLISNIINFVFVNQSTSYDNLPKVSFQPPGYVFGIVWTIIYIFFGSFVFKLLNNPPRFFYPLLCVAFVNFVVNLSWTPMVFVRKNNIYGLYSIFFMIFTLLSMMIMLENDVISKLLLLPYLCWLFVALCLQIELIRNTKVIKKVQFDMKNI